MTEKQSRRFRALIMFVVLWLFGAYIFELLVSVVGGVIGVLSAIAAWVLHTVARIQAAKQVKATWQFYFWLSLPMILLFVLPLVIRAITLWRSETEWTWVDYVESLAPFLYRFVVPAAALLWLYVRVGMLIPFDPEVPPGAKNSPGEADASTPW